MGKRVRGYVIMMLLQVRSYKGKHFSWKGKTKRGLVLMVSQIIRPSLTREEGGRQVMMAAPR